MWPRARQTSKNERSTVDRLPRLRQADLKKLISASGFRLSGSGWYETDFKQGSKRNIVDDKSSATEKPSDSSTQKSTETEKKTAKDSNNKASSSQ